MALRFRLKGLAETIIEEISCPCCGIHSVDDHLFTTDLTRVTFEGIVIVAQCRSCTEIFVPQTQQLGVFDHMELKRAVEKDAKQTGEPILTGLEAVQLKAEWLNAAQRDELH